MNEVSNDISAYRRITDLECEKALLKREIFHLTTERDSLKREVAQLKTDAWQDGSHPKQIDYGPNEV